MTEVVVVAWTFASATATSEFRHNMAMVRDVVAIPISSRPKTPRVTAFFLTTMLVGFVHVFAERGDVPEMLTAAVVEVTDEV